jgi:hypothetical protein
MGSLGFKKFHNEVFFSVLLLSGPEVHKISLADAEGNGFAKSNNPTKKEKIPFLNSVELFRYCNFIFLLFVSFVNRDFSYTIGGRAVYIWSNLRRLSAEAARRVPVHIVGGN